MGDLKVGQTVLSQDGRHGVIRFIGTGSFAAGDWIGLELPDDSGKNNGSVKGERYFECLPGHGIFIRREAVTTIISQAPTGTTGKPPAKPANGSATRPRPSSVITADVARKRQSLMGTGSTGARISTRSPTKSPTKTTHSPASSTTSTPRSGTPSTTNRTSDSSAKSRLSTTGRPYMGPPPIRSAPDTSRSLIGEAATKPTQRTISQPRPSSGASKLYTNLRQDAKPVPAEDKQETLKDISTSPKLAGNEFDELVPSVQSAGEDVGDLEGTGYVPVPSETTTPAQKPLLQASNTSSVARAPDGMESWAALQRDNDSLKSKLRFMEKKRLEDREKIKATVSLQAEKDRLEVIIPALRKKLKLLQSDVSDLRVKCNEAEARVERVDNRSAEHESEIELATLDKEMAEERAQTFQTELEDLQTKHEELKLEAEILREENSELGSVISPEDRATAGWLQMDRERERLKQALVLLRDMSQQNESDLRNQVKELQKDLSEQALLEMKAGETRDQLSKAEAANKHLMEQLEAAEANEDVATALEHEKEAHLEHIERLRQKVQNLEEEAQINNELEIYHTSAQKDLQEQLDEVQAMLHVAEQRSSEQDKVIEDYKYTLTKFRAVMTSQQADIDELRRSKDISEVEAHEMSSKSRAMMDLNLQLQNSAGKTQLKAIDVELARIEAEEIAHHLSILELFVLDSYDVEKNTVLGLLCVRRIMGKADLVSTLLKDRTKDRPHLTEDEPFDVFRVVERLRWIATCCGRFVQFMGSCDVSDLDKFKNFHYEVEPVERAINSLIEALRRDEVSKEDPEHLTRMTGILSDLAEKLLFESPRDKMTELLAHAKMTVSYCESLTGQMGVVVKVIRGRLGKPTEDNEDSLRFDMKMDQLATKTRTANYVAGKAVHFLEEMRSRKMTLAQPAWRCFVEAEAKSEELSETVRKIGMALLDNIASSERSEALSYSSIVETMTRLCDAFLTVAPTSNDEMPHNDFFTRMTSELYSLHSSVEEMSLKAQDLNSCSEFEISPAPWNVLSKQIKSRKVIPSDIQEELNRLKAKVQEQLVSISEKQIRLEEQQIKVELLESRAKESKASLDTLRKLENEIQALKEALKEGERVLDQAKNQQRTTKLAYDSVLLEIDAMKKTGDAAGIVVGLADQSVVLELNANNAQLRSEIDSLQAAVRWLKSEVHRATVPTSAVALMAKEHEWLDPKNLVRRKKPGKEELVETEAAQIYKRLLDVAEKARPLILQPPKDTPHEGAKSTGWRKMSDMPGWHVARQKEAVEKWEGMQADFIRTVKMANRPAKRKAPPSRAVVYGGSVKSPADVEGMRQPGVVEILGSSP